MQLISVNHVSLLVAQASEGCLMNAIVYTHYGSPNVLQLQEVEKPTQEDDEVLVKVHAVSLNAADWQMMTIMRRKPVLARFIIGGFRKPKNPIPGCDLAGRVEAVGKN